MYILHMDSLNLLNFVNIADFDVKRAPIPSFFCKYKLYFLNIQNKNTHYFYLWLYCNEYLTE